MPVHKGHRGKMPKKGKPMPKSHGHMTPEEHRKAMAEMEK